MAGFAAISEVTASLTRLLSSHMVSGAEVTSAPPDITIPTAGTRVNLYLIQLLESAAYRNMNIPAQTPPGTNGQPPLSLELRYLLTSHPEREDQPDAQLAAERALGDAMSVLHHYGPRIDTEAVRNASAGTPGTPVLEAGLLDEYERIRISLTRAPLEDLSKVWSALSTTNYRLSTIYNVSLVQIETEEQPPVPAPVETRALSITMTNRPEIQAARLAVAAGQPQGEARLRIGDTLELEISGTHRADRLYARIGHLEPIRVEADLSGVVQLVLPDTQYAPDLDNPLARPIILGDRLQPGVTPITLETELVTEVLSGALGPGVNTTAPRRVISNVAFVQLVPQITAIGPVSGDFAGVLQITGTRLWRAGARAQVLLGAAAARVTLPEAGDPWATPSEAQIEVPLAAFQNDLPPPQPGGDSYRVAVQIDGARSRDPGFIFTLTP
jgi:Pvc16 N-terminal domain